MYRFLIAFGLGLFLSSLYAADDSQEKSRMAQQAVQGTWKVVKAETGVGPVKAAAGLTYTFTGNRLVTTTVRGGEIKATFSLDATKSPAQLTYVIKDEAREDVLNHAIYELNGDKLKIAGTWNDRVGVSTPFPEEFRPNKGDERSYVLVLEKVKGTK